MERLLIMSDGDAIEADDVRSVVRGDARPSAGAGVAGASPLPAGATAPTGSTPKPATLREFKEWSERAFLVDKLREFGWNISKTAEVIDTPRSNLYKKLEQYAHQAGVGRVGTSSGLSPRALCLAESCTIDPLSQRARRSPAFALRATAGRPFEGLPPKGRRRRREESPNSAGQCAG